MKPLSGKTWHCEVASYKGYRMWKVIHADGSAHYEIVNPDGTFAEIGPRTRADLLVMEGVSFLRGWAAAEEDATGRALKG